MHNIDASNGILIQHTQNRDTDALQVKLDELIRVIKSANNELSDPEEIGEDELLRLRNHYLELARLSREARMQRVVRSNSR